MSLFESLRVRALEALEAFGGTTAALGMTPSCAYCVLRRDGREGVGLALSPHGEGPLAPLKEEVKSMLEHAAAYEPFGRAAALSVMNALFALRRDAMLVEYAPDMRKLLVRTILDATDARSRIVIVGHLRPVVEALRAQGRCVEVFCRSANQPSEGVYNDIFEYEAAMNADILLMTGAALIGSTVDALLALSPNAKMRILAGFSAGIDPQWLQGSGITHVCSVRLGPDIVGRLTRNDFQAVFDYESYCLPV